MNWEGEDCHFSILSGCDVFVSSLFRVATFPPSLRRHARHLVVNYTILSYRNYWLYVYLLSPHPCLPPFLSSFLIFPLILLPTTPPSQLFHIST